MYMLNIKQHTLLRDYNESILSLKKHVMLHIHKNTIMHEDR